MKELSYQLSMNKEVILKMCTFNAFNRLNAIKAHHLTQSLYNKFSPQHNADNKNSNVYRGSMIRVQDIRYHTLRDCVESVSELAVTPSHNA